MHKSQTLCWKTLDTKEHLLYDSIYDKNQKLLLLEVESWNQLRKKA